MTHIMEKKQRRKIDGDERDTEYLIYQVGPGKSYVNFMNGILRHSSEVELIKGKFGWTVSLLDLR